MLDEPALVADQALKGGVEVHGYTSSIRYSDGTPRRQCTAETTSTIAYAEVIRAGT
jgi:hypothetical protein